MNGELAMTSHRYLLVQSNDLQRTAVHSMIEQEASSNRHPSHVRIAVGLGHVFSQVPARASDACPLTPQRCPFGGACHNCPLRVQAKLTVSQPGDKYEEEADRVADQVMSMPEPQVQRACPTCDEEETAQAKPLADQITPLVQCQAAPEEEEEEEPVQTKPLVQRQAETATEDEEEPIQAKAFVQSQAEEESVQTKAAAQQPTTISPGLATQIQSLRGGGQPLPAATRAFFEPRFGYDFSGVRIHTDAQAAETARAIGARAYTIGQDVVFGAGKYMPCALEGSGLMGHELTHVVQQGHAQAKGISGIPDVQRRPASSTSSKKPGSGGPQPKPIRKPDGSCQCRLDICWRPIQLWYVPSYFKHGFINIFDGRCQPHNLYVDPGKHGGHSHAVDSTPGWDTSGEGCLSIRTVPEIVDRLSSAVTRYESMDVAYKAKDGPNSNSFIEWILHEAGIQGIQAPHPGLVAWSYYQENPSKRGSPPRMRRSYLPSK